MKKRILALIALLAGVAAIGWTIAYSRDQTIFNNDFELAKGEVTYTETFKSPDNWKSCDEVSKELVITNNSDVPVNARFKMKGYWKKNGSTSTNQNNEISPVINGQEVAIVNFQNENDWEQKGEWYEYKNVLQKGESTSSLLKSVTLSCDLNLSGEVSYSQDGKTSISGESIYNNARYKLDLTAQTIASNQKTDAWSMATFADGVYANKRIDGLSDADRLEKADNAPSQSINAVDVTGTPSDKSIYMWTENGHAYWYSEAKEVYLPENADFMFSSLSFQTVPGLATVKTSKTTSMKSLFYNGHSSLRDSGPFTTWDVSNVTNFNYAFHNHVLRSLIGFTYWDMSRAQDIGGMFLNDGSDPTYISNTTAIKNWVVSNVTQIGGFMINLTNLDASSLENWDIKPTTRGKNQAFGYTAIKPSWAQ